MNRLVIIGNGFDLAHDLHTSYKDFIDWYWEQRVLGLKGVYSSISEDGLCKFEIKNNQFTWNFFFYVNGLSLTKDANAINRFIEDNQDIIIRANTILLERIIKNIEDKGWTDIERDYYELLKENANDIETCKSLNEQLDFLKDKLVEYLKTQTTEKRIENIVKILYGSIDSGDVSISEHIRESERLKQISPEDCIKVGDDVIDNMTYSPLDNVMILNFNYTSTVKKYTKVSTTINFIHGSLEKPEHIVFGYGDEMDKDYQELIDKNENELLRNSKSVKYLETSNCRKLLQFIDGGLFQVYIIGHSCGNSDRTLLNTIFEHVNCVSIKPFCYINEKGEDNYSELTQNIYRNFTDKKLSRDRVVNKERCTTLEGCKLNL